jgi:hypothetical protein
MRVRPNIEAVAALEFGRAEMVKKDKRADRPAGGMGQRPAYRKAVAQIDAAGNHHHFEGVAGVAIARGRVLAGKKAHFIPHPGDGIVQLARILNLGLPGRLSNIC